jgi:hypothetical protein
MWDGETIEEAITNGLDAMRGWQQCPVKEPFRRGGFPLQPKRNSKLPILAHRDQGLAKHEARGSIEAAIPHDKGPEEVARMKGRVDREREPTVRDTGAQAIGRTNLGPGRPSRARP